EGADIIDIGAESSRPGADALGLEEEWQRLQPVLEGLVNRLEIPISIDTYHVETARRAISSGARMLNDISAGRSSDDAMLRLAAEDGIPICLMHMQGEPKTMQESPAYDDVVGEVDRFLA